jgi:RimJ/RimL family protein N-acetyltransferase
MEIYFRAFEKDDYKTTHSWRLNRNVTNSLGGNTFFVSSSREAEWVESVIENDRTNLYLAICLKENHTLVGYCSLNSIENINKKAELSIVIGDENMQGKGIGLNAVQLLLQHGFQELNLNKIYLKVLTTNKRAIELYKKCGLKEEGILREEVFKCNKYNDMMMMSILKSEYNG